MPPRLLRLDPATPLQPMELDPADFQSPLPQQGLHVAFEDPAIGLTVGLWETTPMQEAFGPYPGDEVVFILDGAFAMIDQDGRGTPAHAGQAVALRSGAPLSWMQAGPLRKVFLTLLPPDASPASLPAAEGGVVVLDPGDAFTDADPVTVSDSGARQRDREVFTNAAGTLTLGQWDTGPLKTDLYPFPCHELARVIEGEVIITAADGCAETFGPGDIFFIPAGTPTRWHVPTHLRKHYATVTPKA